MDYIIHRSQGELEVSNKSVKRHAYSRCHRRRMRPPGSRLRYCARKVVPPSYQLGLHLENAPQIDEQLFIGREDELAHLHEWLSPSTERQNVVAISGLGGMGKTQLGLHFARQHHQRYSAVIWLNASSEVTLKAAYVSLAQRIRRHNKHREAGQSEVAEQLKEEQAVQLVRQ